jgi:nucleoside-diphosphate-sugar epimerase
MLFSGKNIIVTGASGDLGTAITQRLGACPSSGGIFGTNLIPLRHEQTFSSLDN